MVPNNKTFPCFPIPVSIFNFGKDSHEMNVRLVNDIYDEMDYIEKEGLIRSNMGGWHSDAMLHYDSFNMLKEHIEECIEHYCKNNGYYGDVTLDHFWANVNSASNYNIMHHHGESLMTGVYYPVKSIEDDQFVFNYSEEVNLGPGLGELDENELERGGALIFQDPNYSLKTKLTIKDGGGPFTHSHYYLYPVSGVLILFPNYLLHTVTPFFGSEHKRVSISFSCEYTDNIKLRDNGNY